jgi:eukaryotic-like serine/threonine-protein kinase
MGEVYRAYDARLRREVAIKVLPPEFTTDPRRRTRFEREAQALAALTHPNIGAIYGVEDTPGEQGPIVALILELIDGETLADRITRSGPLPLADVIRFAAQIVDALDAAHEKGVVHRDLKPANIKITSDGTLKVLDFGLAKLDAADAGDALTMTGTIEGVVVGTPAYMSPEQARGHAVDRRTDVWAFGCVLFEMLTGTAAFGGVTLSDIIAGVIEREPEWARVPPAVPGALKRLLRWSLEKDSRRRLRDIADARLLLTDATNAESIDGGTARIRRSSRIPWLIAAAALVLAAAGWWMAERRSDSRSPKETVALKRMTWNAGLSTEPALSPDGSLLVYAAPAPADDNLELWMQRVSGGTPVRLTQDAADDREPDISPDGSLIAFRSERNGGGVYVMPTLGGDARLVAPQGRRPRFSPDGRSIAFWTGRWLGGSRTVGTAVSVVPVNGGDPRVLSPRFVNARNPVWAPDGRSVLFFGRKAGVQASSAISADTALDAEFDWWRVPIAGGPPAATGVYRTLIENGFAFLPAWELDALPEVWTNEGVLFSGTTADTTNLWQLPISIDSGRVAGPLVQVTSGAGADVHPSRDRTGRIAFEQTDSAESVFRLALDVGAAKSLSQVVSLVTDWGFTAHRGSLSQDSRTLAYPKHRPDHSELWLRDLSAGVDRHLATTAAAELNPSVSPDGTQVAYTVVEKQRSFGYVIPAAGGAVRRVCEDCAMAAWLNDNRRILTIHRTSEPILRVLDTQTQSTTPLFAAAGVNRAFVTADDKWAAIGGTDVAWLVPLANRTAAATAADALTITFPKTDVTPGRIVGWSPDGSLLYSLLGLDGFRCLYAQRVDLERRTPQGQPIPVHHFHDPARLWGSTPMSNAIVDKAFVFDQLTRSGTIWLVDRQVPNH